MISTPTTRIRNLFLHPHPTYSIGAAAVLLGIDGSEIRAWIGSGEIEAVGTDDELPWSEGVMLGVEIVWTQPAVEEALGEDLRRAMPAPVQLAELRLPLPRFRAAGPPAP